VVPHWRTVPPSPVRERLVIVAPRPGDEVLACGGLVLWCDHHAVDLTIVAVTDGEPPVPGSVAEEAARTRVSERDEALSILGTRANVRRLGLPDAASDDRRAELADRLVELLDPGTVCVAPWRADGPAEYEGVAQAAAQASAAVGATLWEAPVWGRLEGRFELSVPRRQALDLGRVLRTRKQAAVRAFRDPLTPRQPGSLHTAVMAGRAVQALTTSVEWYWCP
jgi:LmbE family N-acetylglucosaminyl deacetylase